MAPLPLDDDDAEDDEFDPVDEFDPDEDPSPDDEELELDPKAAPVLSEPATVAEPEVNTLSNVELDGEPTVSEAIAEESC